MYRIAISGKAKSGKNTVSKIFIDSINEKITNSLGAKCIAFADPIKEMAMIMFPHIPAEYFFGASELRSEIIEGAFKDGKPLTVREVLIDIGTKIGRGYKNSIWLDVFDHRFENYKDITTLIVSDVRYRNEFDHLKQKNFYTIRIRRNDHLKINDESEIEQDSIEDSEFDCIIHNNSSLEHLKKDINKIVDILLK